MSLGLVVLFQCQECVCTSTPVNNNNNNKNKEETITTATKATTRRTRTRRTTRQLEEEDDDNVDDDDDDEEGFVVFDDSVRSLVVDEMTTSSSSSSSVRQRQERQVQQEQLQQQRQQQQDFRPLSCNSNIFNVDCTSFTWRYGWNDIYTDRIVIECGTCYIMDHFYDNIIFLDGIDIVGKLIIPDHYKITITTTILSIQGILHITSTKPIDGQPNVKIIMIGQNDDETFDTAEDNIGACGPKCIAGKKAIVVAGGQLNVLGIPSKTKTPTWVKLYDVKGGDDPMFPTSIVVDKSVQGHWAKGASILITSHTQYQEDRQERTIMDVLDYSRRYVELVLDEPINRPTTILDHDDNNADADLAVEVALLSRNIIFEGGMDDEEFHGGHFWVLRTPYVKQSIIGVQFRNFGQQGNLGRYSIHFHMCRDVKGSIVSKNTIIHSNQRCIVVHGSDNLLIQENIAYNTVGHCYILEDGVENGNQFINNLGAMTTRPKYHIMINGEQESDGSRPSTYWITTGNNTFIGNIAAGSIASGIWIEFLARGPFKDPNMTKRIDARSRPLGIFHNNVVHSNRVGLRTYPKGFRPNYGEAIISGFKAYNNYDMGMFIHISKNIIIENSLFANNKLSIDINRADGIEIRNSKFIAMTNSYYKNVIEVNSDQQQPKQFICPKNDVVGIDIHSYRTNHKSNGTTISGVTFQGYGDTKTMDLCKNSYPLQLSRLTGKKFDMFTKVDSVSFVDDNINTSSNDKSPPPPFHFCHAVDASYEDAFVIDLDGSLRPPGLSSFSTRSNTLVADRNVKETMNFDHFMYTFIKNPQMKCTKVRDGCYGYCTNTCFRTIRFFIDPAAYTAYYTLKICSNHQDHDHEDVNNGNNRCVTLTPQPLSNGYGVGFADRQFVAHLPGDGIQYIAYMMDKDNNYTTISWPSFVYWYYDDVLCPGGISPGDVQLYEPPIQQEQQQEHNDDDAICTQLIRNGDAELSYSSGSSSTTGYLYPTYWIAGLGDLYIGIGQGIANTNSFTGNEEKSFFMVQYLDSRCFKQQQQQMIGETYKVSMKIKELDSQTGNPVICKRNTKTKMIEACPNIGIRGFYDESAISFDIQFIDTNYNTDAYNFQHIEGIFHITEEFITASKIYVYIVGSNNNKKNKYNVHVDDVSIEKII